MKLLKSNSKNFVKELQRVLDQKNILVDKKIEIKVRKIILDIKKKW